MRKIQNIALAALALAVSACSTAPTAVSRNEPAALPLVARANPVDFSIKDVRISVPKTLIISEENIYYPTADIVWHGEAYGNRYDQVGAIFNAAMKHGVRDMKGHQKVYLDVEVTRFHSLTKRARYTVGGVHSIKFVYSLRDAKTNALIGKPRLVSADLKAFGGNRALKAEHKGLTQKVRIMSHLASLIKTEINATQERLSQTN